MTRYKAGYFVGSLATVSINRLLAKALVRLRFRDDVHEFAGGTRVFPLKGAAS